MSNRALSILRRTARQAENIRWENDRGPGAASRRARREEGRGKGKGTGESPGITELRRRELKRLFARRWGLVLPEDDSGRDDVQLFADHCGEYGFNLLQQFCRMFAPWLSADDMVKAFRQRRVVKWTADALGEKLRLTDEERTALGIRTIGAFDCNKAARTKRRKRKAQVREAKRRAD